MSYSDWHDQIMEEDYPTIIECLEENKLFSLERTQRGLQIIELCDGYFGTTLSNDQLRRLIDELKQLLDAPYPPAPISDGPIGEDKPADELVKTQAKEVKMTKKQVEYKGHVPVYGPKPDTDYGSIIGGVFFVIIILLCLSQCSG
ncbi:MAG: hypothetical protein KUG65_09755 [Sphingomonadaceae bacterium]|nr:hypothetical protein [Sphingomonadaceae bacterium]